MRTRPNFGDNWSDYQLSVSAILATGPNLIWMAYAHKEDLMRIQPSSVLYILLLFATAALLCTVGLGLAGVIPGDSIYVYAYIAFFAGYGALGINALDSLARMRWMPRSLLQCRIYDSAAAHASDSMIREIRDVWRGSRRAMRGNPIYSEMGIVGHIPNAVGPSRSSGRQRSGASGRRSPTKKSGKKDSDGGDGDGGDPPLQAQRLYTYAQLAVLVSCAEKTLRNKVSNGQFPRPIKTLFGPRFTDEHFQLALSPPPQIKRGKGRPRVAQNTGGKGGEQ
ncbi:hypothetical protein B1757_04690 [Acidithiobacillus marinus]|uniref:Uncharacterized protein n=1 Tax=Acidithiobacillus marinus TaxID=187490 RepID=A0A2I1DNS8_9PROT|nr:hypothetical protein [Acidithiobacillus marinus]PKY11513.1 hypothetical protein B1757_04690 [Acidithiobacillus marinus]